MYLICIELILISEINNEQNSYTECFRSKKAQARRGEHDEARCY